VNVERGRFTRSLVALFFSLFFPHFHSSSIHPPLDEISTNQNMPIELPFTTHVENGVLMLSPSSIPDAPSNKRDMMHSFMATYAYALKVPQFIDHIPKLFRHHFSPYVESALFQKLTTTTDPTLDAIKKVYEEIKDRVLEIREDDLYQTMDDCISFLFDGYDLDYLKTYKRTDKSKIISADEWFSQIQ
jgi:hypothetical protein